jgi:hydrogenase nickel insertion protein HypA
MHEYSITSSIVEIVEKIAAENKLSKVERIDFEISPFSSIEPDSIKFYYEYLTGENSVLKNAELKFKKVKYKSSCSRCNTVFETDQIPVICPDCLTPNKVHLKTDDIIITSIRAE